MENTVVAENPTTAEKIARGPAQVGTEVVHGTETVLHDAATVVVKAGEAVADAATVLVDATKTVAVDAAAAGHELGRDIEHAVAPGSRPERPTAAPSTSEVAV